MSVIEIKSHPITHIIVRDFLDITSRQKLIESLLPIRENYLERVIYTDPNGVVKKYKIASRTCLLKDPYALETLQEKSHTKKPVIISMGMGGNRKRIEKIFSRNKKIFCYCISEYPTKITKIDWKKAIKYDGFSDHTLGITAPLIFTMLKKQQNTKNILIEKHVKLSNSRGPDADSSIDTEELANLVSAIRKIEKVKI